MRMCCIVFAVLLVTKGYYYCQSSCIMSSVSPAAAFFDDNSNSLVLHFYNIVQNSIKINASEPETSSSLFHAFLFLVNLAPALPTGQLKWRQFGRRIECFMLVAAWGASYKDLVSSHLEHHTPDLFHFQTCSLQPQLTLPQVTSLKGIYLTSYNSLSTQYALKNFLQMHTLQHLWKDSNVYNWSSLAWKFFFCPPFFDPSLTSHLTLLKGNNILLEYFLNFI